jgi:methane/ammonia monooxygenase subunit B
MNVKNIFKLCVIGSLGMATLGLTLAFNVSTAAAHGERSQEPFLRMRTAQWYEMESSEDQCQRGSHVVRQDPYF